MIAKFFSTLSFIAFTFLMMPAHAGSISDTKIKKINYRSNSMVVMFDKTFDSKCEDNGVWAILRYEDSEGNRRLFSLILSAAAAGNTVNIISSGCDYHNGIDQLHVKY